ncbi:hypothetical protein EJB05_44822, partial [Eragrostis curvula]
MHHKKDVGRGSVCITQPRHFAMDDVHGSAHGPVWRPGAAVSSSIVSVTLCKGSGCGVLPCQLHPRVESQELTMLEFLVRPQPKEGHGVFGGEWKRPSNVFAAAKNFAKRLDREE